MPAVRFAILADIHLGTRGTQFPGQDLTYAPDLLCLAATAIKPHNVDELVIVGDLVNMGLDEEYAIARSALRDVGAPVSTVPGNHELVKATLDDFRSRSIGPRTAESRESGAGPTLAWLNSGIEGLPMWHWHGRLDDAGLGLLDRITSKRGDRALIAFCHHPPEGTV